MLYPKTKLTFEKKKEKKEKSFSKLIFGFEYLKLKIQVFI